MVGDEELPFQWASRLSAPQPQRRATADDAGGSPRSAQRNSMGKGKPGMRATWADEARARVASPRG